MSGHNCRHNWFAPKDRGVFLCDSIRRTTLKRMENFLGYLFHYSKVTHPAFRIYYNLRTVTRAEVYAKRC